jgi:hypothetical protein
MGQILRVTPFQCRRHQDKTDALLWRSIIDAYHHADESDDTIELSDIIPAGFPDPGIAGQALVSWRWHRD